MKDLSKISVKFLKKISSIIIALLLVVFFYICFEVYVPINPASHETIIYTVQKGWGDEEIAKDLKKMAIIRNNYFFNFYVFISLQDSKLQAGEYNLSSKMSVYEIAKKMTQGDVIKDNIVILEGWDIDDIGKYLQEKGACDQNCFISLTQKDYSNDFDFLVDKPKSAGLEGYLFPDTYRIAKGETCEDIIDAMLANFGKKLTLDLRAEIKNQKKTIFDIITMASMIEKEVREINDKKIVSGVLWKRLSIGMPLQLDCTVNYITGKSDASCTIKDTKIDSPYNTYKYKGLPMGPISNPGIDSITAAIYPKTTNYWFYLSDGTTHFSETLAQHNAARVKYLGK
jgi:UPF0755 protein